MELRNLNHGFDVDVEDVGVTIRKGLKWAEVPIGTHIDLWVCSKSHEGPCAEEKGCQHVGEGVKVGHWVGPFGNIPRGLLRMEHNIAARDKTTLIQMLRDAYGKIEKDDIVTALIYLRTK